MKRSYLVLTIVFIMALPHGSLYSAKGLFSGIDKICCCSLSNDTKKKGCVIVVTALFMAMRSSIERIVEKLSSCG